MRIVKHPPTLFGKILDTPLCVDDWLKTMEKRFVLVIGSYNLERKDRRVELKHSLLIPTYIFILFFPVVLSPGTCKMKAVFQPPPTPTHHSCIIYNELTIIDIYVHHIFIFVNLLQLGAHSFSASYYCVSFALLLHQIYVHTLSRKKNKNHGGFGSTWDLTLGDFGANHSYGTLKFLHVCKGKPCICNVHALRERRGSACTYT